LKNKFHAFFDLPVVLIPKVFPKPNCPLPVKQAMCCLLFYTTGICLKKQIPA
jgi:hypothetical protein